VRRSRAGHRKSTDQRMWRKALLLTVFGAALLMADRAQSGRADEVDKPAPLPFDLDKLRPGTSQAEVQRRLGPPKRTARQILYRRYLEQWVYEGPSAVRIEFNCVHGKEPQILTVHPLTLPQP
jgi:hypothetical protein